MGDSGADAISVDWNKYSGCVIEAVKALFDDTRLADVTLACEGQFVTAHQFLLSASSPFFKDLFELHLLEKGKHSVVLLCGVQMKFLKRVLQFIYTGRVQITRNDLDEFLETGEILKIRGLCSSSNSDSEDTQSNESPKSITTGVKTPRQVNSETPSPPKTIKVQPQQPIVVDDVKPPPVKRRFLASDHQPSKPVTSQGIRQPMPIPGAVNNNYTNNHHNAVTTTGQQPKVKQQAATDEPIFMNNLWGDLDNTKPEDDEEDADMDEGGSAYEESFTGEYSRGSRGNLFDPGRSRTSVVKAETLLKLGRDALQARDGFQLSARAQMYFDYLGHLPPLDVEGNLSKKQIERRKRRFFARCKLCAKEISACGCDHDLLSHLRTHRITFDQPNQ